MRLEGARWQGGEVDTRRERAGGDRARPLRAWGGGGLKRVWCGQVQLGEHSRRVIAL